jgi:hypothetical protein
MEETEPIIKRAKIIIDEETMMEMEETSEPAAAAAVLLQSSVNLLEHCRRVLGEWQAVSCNCTIILNFNY